MIKKYKVNILGVISILGCFFLNLAQACGLEIPAGFKFEIKNLDNCSFLIKNRKNYFNLNYYRASNYPIEFFLKNENFVARDGDEIYLTVESIDEPNYSVDPIKQNPLKRLKNNIAIWSSESSIRVVSLPKKQNQSKDNTFSIKLLCINMAGEKPHGSFITRYCTPETQSAKYNLLEYQRMILGINISSLQ